MAKVVLKGSLNHWSLQNLSEHAKKNRPIRNSLCVACSAAHVLIIDKASLSRPGTSYCSPRCPLVLPQLTVQDHSNNAFSPSWLRCEDSVVNMGRHNVEQRLVQRPFDEFGPRAFLFSRGGLHMLYSRSSFDASQHLEGNCSLSNQEYPAWCFVPIGG